MATTGGGSSSFGEGMVSRDKSPMLFVSHHSSKLEVAEHVERALNIKGVRCWIAPRDVEPGASFARAIPQAIGESSAVLLLFCSNSAKSRHVERELILADQLGKAIIPLRLERIDPGELSYHLAASQWIDWLEQRDEAIDRIALKARDLQVQAQNGTPKTGTVSIDEPEAKPAVDITKAKSTPPPPAPPPPLPPVSLDRSVPARPPRSEAPGSGAADTGAQPHEPMPAEPGKPSKLPLFLALGGVGAVLLIALIYFAVSMRSPATVTETWFAGAWSYDEDCGEPIRFDSNGDLVTASGERGTWSIEDGRTLVAEMDEEVTRSTLARVGRDEVRTGDGSLFRCD
ncbi:toll/interleukin-1 receptor domain-containing protein [Sphingosinicella sp. YJ22]|uniref:toll/interleukin-1 receptor domain-containing protein n=1 Tax=Sphingosinicella sp. YJ22 TaxID=1104780 RepID=UPI00140A97E0|nr:toll/interleukin-1 receptor domain-containing protein [Sphingosinicella sp. YJ22]